MLEVVAGVVVSLAALALVLEPLLRSGHSATAPERDDVEFIALEESASPKIQALLALREIEFDRATGKLSDEDYAALKAKYSASALAAIHSEERADAAAVQGESGSGDLEALAEAAVSRMRSRGPRVCAECGPRPETGALFCSSCGRTLANPDARPRCGICGAPIPSSAKYCPGCGEAVAA